MKLHLCLVMICFSYTVLGQAKIDLSKSTFDEQIDPLIEYVEFVNKGLLFDDPYMVSYGIDQNSKFFFDKYLPEHIELLSWNGILKGFAFRIQTYQDLEDLKTFLVKKYDLKKVDASPNATIYRVVNGTSEIELFDVTAEQFKTGRKGYLSVKNLEFIKHYDLLDKKTSRTDR